MRGLTWLGLARHERGPSKARIEARLGRAGLGMSQAGARRGTRWGMALQERGMSVARAVIPQEMV